MADEPIELIPVDPLWQQIQTHRAATATLLACALTARKALKLLGGLPVTEDVDLTAEVAEVETAVKALDSAHKHVLNKLDPLDPFDPAEWKPDVMNPLASKDWVVLREISRDEALTAVGFSRSRLHDFYKDVEVTEFPPEGTEPWPSKGAMVTPHKVKHLEHNVNAIYHDKGVYSVINYRGPTRRLVKEKTK